MKRKPKRKPEPVTPDLISEVRAACDARRQADFALFTLLCRVYRNPFHWRLPRDYFKSALAWLNRHDPDVRYYARIRSALARQIAHDLDDAFINGDPPKRATKAHAARSRSKVRPRVRRRVQAGDRQRRTKERERKRRREDKAWADNIAFDEP